MEVAALVAENGIQRHETQNLQLNAEQVASSGGFKSRREHFLARRAREQRLRRMAETEEQRKARIAKDRERARLRRLAETEEKKRARLAKEAEKLRLRRRKQKEKSKHSGTDAEILSTSEMIHSQTDSDKCEEGQGGSQQSETSSEQIAPSTSSKTTVEHEPNKEDLTPKRLSESEQRKERLAKVIDKVKLGKVKEIDQQITKCYARIAEVIGTDKLVEISHVEKIMEGKATERPSPSCVTLPRNEVSEPSTHLQDSVLYSLLSSPDEVSLPKNPLQPGKTRDAVSDQQLVPTHDTDAIGSLQPLPVEAGVAGDVLENEGRTSRNSQSLNIVVIREIVKVADKIGTPTMPQKQPNFDSMDRGQENIRCEVEPLSCDSGRKPKSWTRNARKTRVRRWAETEEQRKDRLARQAKRNRLKRSAETEEQKRARLAKDRENAKLRRRRALEQKTEGVAKRKS